MPEFTLLLVDDEANVVRSLKRLLADTDYEILTASSGAEGLQTLAEHDVQLVISDYRMPTMDGVEFLTRVREKYPDTVRMILSGYADTASVVDAINEGQIYKFVAKPWNDQDLLTTISTVVERCRLQKENAQLYEELMARYQELEGLNKTLEYKVAERTRDLEMKNRALTVAHTVIDALPAGVLGIDSEGTIVYMNGSLKQFIDMRELGLGLPASGTVDERILTPMNRAITEQRPQVVRLPDRHGIGLVCMPLPGQVGSIGVFSYLNLEDYVTGPEARAETPEPAHSA